MEKTTGDASEQMKEPSLIDLKEDLVRALTHFDQKFRTLVELLPASLMVHRGGRIIYVNPSWLKLTGYDQVEELVGQSALMFVHPDYQQLVKERIARLNQGQADTPLQEQIWLKKSGETIVVEAEGVSVAYDGIPAVMVIARDISIRKKAQEEARISEENFRGSIARMTDGVVINNEEHIIFANESLARLLGYGSADEMVGKPISDLAHPDYREELSRRIRNVYEKNASNPLREAKILRKDGEPLSVEAVSFPILFGGRMAIMAIMHDISLRKRALDDLKQAKMLLERAQEAGRVGTWVADLKKGGRTSWSKESCALFGVDPKKFDGTVESFYSMVHPEDREMLLRESEKNAQGNGKLELEYRIIRTDGAVRWVHSRYEVMRDAGGVPAELIGTVQDITDRKEVEQGFREREGQLRVVFENSFDSMFILDDEGRIWDANSEACRLAGIEKSELLKHNFKEFKNSEHDSTVFEADLQRNGSGHGQCQFIRPDGEARDVESNIKLNIFPGKHLVALMDITEKLKINRQVLLNDKLATVGTLAAGVAHEINNPLTFILANLGFLKEHLDELKDYLTQDNKMDLKAFNLLNELHEEVKEADGGMDRVRDIVRSLKTFVHSGDDETSEVDLNQAVDSALNMVFHEIKHKAKVEKEYDARMPLLKAKTGKLQQAFINILVNAAQAIEPNNPNRNRIRVRTGFGGGNAFVEIEDTGKGISQENLGKIFDPFFTTKPAGVGTGLGLSISRDIVKSYGGEILVRSGVGKGSAFTVCLPVGASRPEVMGTNNPPVSVEKHGRRVLVVDDEPANVEAFGLMLKKQHEVLYALSGLDALSILAREKGAVDAIVSDLNMPDVDGVGLYKMVAQRFPGLEQRIIFVTGGIFKQATRDYLKTLPNRLLEKPFPTRELVNALGHLLAPPTT